jgi:hypothetical protein
MNNSAMDLQTIKENAARYILERTCPGGGFCFYRLDEPNPQDTYFALATLDLLEIPYRAERTVRYLQAIQQTDGVYESLAQTFFVLLGLRYLDSQSLHDPTAGVERLTDWLLSSVSSPGDTRSALFAELYQVTLLREAMNLDWREGQRQSIIRLLHAHHHRDGGFGVETSNLLETFHAAAVLRRISHPVALTDVEPFLRACEHPVFGFTGKPATSLFFLEYLHAGLALCNEIALLPTYGAACASFLYQCQTNSGGFARTNLAIATLENTCFAIHGIQILAKIMDLG